MGNQQQLPTLDRSLYGDSQAGKQRENEHNEQPQQILSVKNVKIGYEVENEFNLVINDISFDIRSGETIMMIGPSGCGKSTLLKTIAGFNKPIAGDILLAGRTDLEPGPDRAVVFQEHDQLFPWRTVFDNLVYSLRVTGRKKSEAIDSAKYYLEMTNLSRAHDLYPHQLSGGMKQRVAIARALALEPSMLLMDEPFGALDALTRTRLQEELRLIAEKTRVTIFFVTHSIEEAVLLADRIIVLTHPPSYIAEIVNVGDKAKNLESDESIEIQQHLRKLLGS
ncbi:ABC transporter ATP-binding protein [Bacillus sp. JJ1532]|uniref:ABC transporter ATP-binding protein n=1 Tax=unclassified Bacillus (in: firmicutes) TaxID=185979 RepID=UPI002FFEF437